MMIYWLTQAIAYWALVFLLVPYNYIVRLLPYAFLGGFAYTWIVQYIAIHFLGYWSFAPDVFMIMDIPLFFVLSWFAVTLAYGYILYRYPKEQLWTATFFVIWATINNYVSLNFQQITFISWSIAQTFMLAIFSHVLLIYVLKYMYGVEELGAKKDILATSLAALKLRNKN